MKKQKLKTKTKRDIKIIIWLMALIALVGIYNTHQYLTPVEASAPYAKIWQNFPESPDKTNLTDREKMFISASKECNKRDLGATCINDIMGMANRESRFNCSAVGDFGASHGCLQIHLGFHPTITQDQARDPEFAVKWTLDRLIHYGYPEQRSRAIMKHNGTPGTEKTLRYLASVNSY